ncbi:MAG: ankyrin repeat domain-containing protein [Phycisphaeraceae bacterium]|nr:ankyrin repeat domain-containing protein [Phycisphaeraceae bacterium]
MPRKPPEQAHPPGIDRLGRTPLHYAALDGDDTLIQRLLTDGLDPNLADDNGWTPLHFACQSSSAKAVRALLDAGANVNAMDLNGNSPLFRAVFESRGRGEVIALLRSSGADPHQTNGHGVSPVMLARSIANHDARQFFVDVSQSDDQRAMP